MSYEEPEVAEVVPDPATPATVARVAGDYKATLNHNGWGAGQVREMTAEEAEDWGPEIDAGYLQLVTDE